MANKFKEIRQVEEEIKKQIDAAKKKGEEQLVLIEKEEVVQLEKMRQDLKAKRNEMFQKAISEGEKEKSISEKEAEEEIKKMIVSEEDIKKASLLVAEEILSLQ